jgi:hypothetical protein
VARPYLSLAIETLEALFDQQRDDPHVLEQLAEELSCRQTKRAHSLLSLVAGRLGTLQPDDDMPAGPELHYSGPDALEDQGVVPADANEANAIAETRPSDDDRPESSDPRHNDLELNDAPSLHVRGGSPSRSRASPTPSHLEPEAQDAEQPPDDRKFPRQLSRMRPPGTAGLPEAWVPSRSQDLVLALSRDADSPDLYITALTALVAEIKKTGAGQKRYELMNLANHVNTV